MESKKQRGVRDDSRLISRWSNEINGFARWGREGDWSSTFGWYQELSLDLGGLPVEMPSS